MLTVSVIVSVGSAWMWRSSSSTWMSCSTTPVLEGQLDVLVGGDLDVDRLEGELGGDDGQAVAARGGGVDVAVRAAAPRPRRHHRRR
jgi:hypothetical protein